MISVSKQGLFTFNQDKEIINNPCYSNSITDWTNLIIRNGMITNRISDGAISSSSFSIANNEIIKVSISLLTTNFVSGSGIYIGTNVGSCYRLYTWNSTTRTYTESTPSGTYATYFFSNFLSTSSVGNITSYIIGYDVPISLVPPIESNGISNNLCVVKLNQNIGTTYIRSGNNSADGSNEWTFYNLGLYRHSKIKLGNKVNLKIYEMNPLSIKEIYED